MFRGNQPTRVDEKGRLKLPADYKRLVEEKYGQDTKFYITSKTGLTAEIYPLPEWEKIEAKLALIPSMDKAKKKFLDRVNYYGQMAEMDAQGRILLPQLLREKARLSTDVAVIGKQIYLEVENNEQLVNRIETEPFTDDDAQAMANFGV
jgi:MraZ protein